jgi:hypothetical protein
MSGDTGRETPKTVAIPARVFDCDTCADFGFVRIKGTDEVVPCPKCNPDGMDGIQG